MEKSRLTWVDALKGFAIFLVVLGHTTSFEGTPYKEFGSGLVKWIYSFHIPLFFMISGFFLADSSKENNGISWIYRRAKRLLIPYFVYGLLLALTLPAKDFVLSGDLNSYLQSVTNGVLGLLYGNGNYWPVWFLSALFVSHVFFYFTLNLLKINKAILALILLMIFILQLIFKTTSMLPWEIDLIPLVSLFMLLGNFIFRAIAKLKPTYTYYLVVLLCLMIIGSIATANNVRVDINSRMYGNCFLFAISSVSISSAFILFANLFATKKNWGIVGRASLVILGCHIPIGAFAGHVIDKAIFSGSVWGILLHMFLLAVIQVLLCTLIYKIFKKFNFKFLI